MGWSTIINADFGKYRMGMQNAIIAPSDRYSTLNGQRQYLYPSHNINQGAITVQNMGVNIPIEDIHQGEWVNAFGFKLYQQGVYTNKVAMCRFYGSTVLNTPNDINRYYNIQWAIFDENTHNYTWLGQYYIEVGIVSIGSVHWKDVKCNLVFQVREETLPDAQGGQQNVIYGGIYCYANDSDYGSQYAFVGLGMAGIGEKWHLGLYDSLNPQGTDFSPEFGPAAEEGGYGPQEPGGASGGAGGPGPTFDSDSDPWTPTPMKPGVLSFGLLNIYKCDNGAMNNLGDTLFPAMPTFPSPPQPSQGASLDDIVKWCGDVAQWTTNIVTAFFESVWNKGLIDYIVSVHLIPVDVAGGAMEDIKIGPRTLTGILARPIRADVIAIDCGSIHIDEFYTSYIDYMTVCRIYIPYFGMVTLRPEYWQSATLQLKYLWNVIDGSFIAQLFSTITRHQKPCTTMVGQYSGSACVHMPLSGANYASMFSMLTGAAGSIAAGAATGNVAVAAASALALPGAINGDMMMGNAYNASSAFYGHSRPFVIIERPVSHFSQNYTVEKGLPLLTRMKIGDCSGFTQAEDIILDGIPCTQAEKEKIRAFFKNGVIIK